MTAHTRCLAGFVIRRDRGTFSLSLYTLTRRHHLRAESCKWHGGSSICDKCECGEVQDEKHVLFFCKCA